MVIATIRPATAELRAPPSPSAPLAPAFGDVGPPPVEPGPSPLDLETAGLPAREGGCGLPFGRLGRDSARVVEGVFARHGIALRPHRIHDPGLKALVDGYDPEHRVGYVLLDRRRLDTDAYVPRGFTDSSPGVSYKRLSMPEIQQLVADANSGRRFIAVISAFDRRLPDRPRAAAHLRLERDVERFIQWAYAHPARWR